MRRRRRLPSQAATIFFRVVALDGVENDACRVDDFRTDPVTRVESDAIDVWHAALRAHYLRRASVHRLRVRSIHAAPRLRRPEKCAPTRYPAANAAVRVQRRPQVSEEWRLGDPGTQLPGANRRGTLASRIFRGRLPASSDGLWRAACDRRARTATGWRRVGQPRPPRRRHSRDTCVWRRGRVGLPAPGPGRYLAG